MGGKLLFAPETAQVHKSSLLLFSQAKMLTESDEMLLGSTSMTRLVTRSDVGTMDSSNPFSYITLSWLDKTMLLALKKALDYEDLPGLREHNKAEYLHNVISSWREELVNALKEQTPGKDAAEDAMKIRAKSPFLCIFNAYLFQVLLGMFLDAASTAISVLMPIVLGAIINAMLGFPDPNITFLTSGLGLALFLFGLALARILFKQISAQLLRNYQVDMMTILTGAVFEKALNLSNRSTKSFTEGRVLQMINTDVRQTANMAVTGYRTLIIPAQIVFVIWFLVRLVGSSVSAAAMTIGVAVLVLVPVAFGYVTSQNSFFAVGDRRIKIFREVMLAMKIIKLRGSEDEHEKDIMNVRQEQLGPLKGLSAFMGLFVTILFVVPVAMPVATFLLFSQEHSGQMNPAIIFPALSYFSMLFAPLLELPQLSANLIMGLLSWRRIKVFLNAEERESIESDNDPDNAVVFDTASFRWESHKGETGKEEGASENNSKITSAKKGQVKPEEEAEHVEDLFREMNLKIPKGKLTAIVGPVGCGKSSLISACTGEMTRTGGRVYVNGTVAMCQQQPWLLSTTIKDNILFNRPFDKFRLDDAIKCCALDGDIVQLDNGIKTEIGEKGIALSGGQKARIALARAVYSDSEIYLLDDPLAALDAHVGKHVFEECIRKTLHGKTRVLITHQLHVLSHVDNVVVMKDGVVAEQGTYEEVLAMNGVLSDLMKDYEVDSDEDEDPRSPKKGKAVKKRDKTVAKAPKHGLITQEGRERGAVKLSVLGAYLNRSGGLPVIFLLLFAFLAVSASQTGASIWLAIWTEQKISSFMNSEYLNVYIYISAGQILFTLILGYMIIICAYFSAKNFHNGAIRGLLKAPMSWFDSQPVGRIVNRLSGDMETLDQALVFIFMNSVFMTMSLISQFASIAYSSQWILILFGILAVIFSFILQIYRSAIREVRRVSATAKSPLVSHISESLGGLATIRTFGKSDEIITKQRELINIANVPTLIEMSVVIWLNLRVELLASLITFVVAIMGVETTTISPALLGLALSQASDLTASIGHCVNWFAQGEAALVSVERLKEYIEDLPVEAAETCADDPDFKAWPTKGEIEIKNLVVKYASRDEPVLKELDVNFKGGEKIGIVGRSGCGKSSLLTALFRLVEAQSGTVLIDGLDIQKLGLKTLRRRMQIIPQEPILFSGTIRSNMDPGHIFTDTELWSALELVSLKHYISELPQKLESAVEDGGANLSVGQRQLLILARAICHRPRILVLDEASSAVDVAADMLIQSTIQTQFSGATVISIAHRLNTVAAFDRILVLDAGCKMEYDTPANLLRIKGGIFKSLVDATGQGNADHIREVAEAHEKEVIVRSSVGELCRS